MTENLRGLLRIRRSDLRNNQPIVAIEGQLGDLIKAMDDDDLEAKRQAFWQLAPLLYSYGPSILEAAKLAMRLADLVDEGQELEALEAENERLRAELAEAEGRGWRRGMEEAAREAEKIAESCRQTVRMTDTKNCVMFLDAANGAAECAGAIRKLKDKAE